MAHQEKMLIRPRLNSKISKIFFVYSISETNSLILPVHLPLCSIYMFRALLPLKWSCSWEFCFLLQSSHVTQLSNPVGRTELRNLISFIWQICGKGKFRIWLYGAAFICIRQTTGLQSWQLCHIYFSLPKSSSVWSILLLSWMKTFLKQHLNKNTQQHEHVIKYKSAVHSEGYFEVYKHPNESEITLQKSW